MLRKAKFYIVYLLVFGLMHFTFKSNAQHITVKAKLDTTEFLIGDQIGLELEVRQPIKEFVGIPIFEQNVNQELEVLEQSENDTTLLETGHFIIRKRLLVTAFDSGYYALPPIPFLYYSDTLRTDPILFHVKTIPVDTSQAIKDIKRPYGAPLSFAEVFPWAGGSLILALVIFILIYVIKKLRRKEPIIRRIKPREPAHIIAFRGLEKLKKDKLWQQEKIKEYYTDLTDILRLYLWNRYSIRTLERTSEEILESLEISDFNDEEAYDILKDVFQVSDLVKFAKFKPIADEHEKCLSGAYNFVDRTKLIIEEKKDAEEDKKDNNSSLNSENEEVKMLEEQSNP